VGAASASVSPLPPAFCGNGIVESGEQCDPPLKYIRGRPYSTFKGLSCCAPTCQFEAAGSACAKSPGPCLSKRTCNGSGVCNPAKPLKRGTICRKKKGPRGIVAGRCNGAGRCV